MAKKKRAENQATEEEEIQAVVANGTSYDDAMKTKKRKKKKKAEVKGGDGVNEEVPTVSIAVAGSIIDNAQSLELATRLASQIARAATIFRIDEVVVFDNKSISADESHFTLESTGEDSAAAFLIRVLRYLETPQYLRRALFPMHNSLRFVGMLPPLDAPHHLRKHEWAPYREGVTLNERPSNAHGTLVDVGLSKNVLIDQLLEPGVRVTVAMGHDRNLDSGKRYKIVSSSKPKEEGMYWGYTVRYASNISSVSKNCPYKGSYDYLIGTSEHGLVVKSSELHIPACRHLLISFGGLAGLEESVEEDTNLKGKDVRDVFDTYLNTCPNQGSRTIRTEEAILISLQYFQEPISRARFNK
uniref:RNA methyltransferase n=1 Tax=Kalanchoe fedtschenkoi TaxID=63787 RepID=A0A7N0TY26_KALFE